MVEVVLDCTELLANPVRTGIQRVVRELIRHWPEDGPKPRLAHFDRSRGLCELSSEARSLLIETDSIIKSMSVTTLQHRLGALANRSVALRLDPISTILIPEVFYDSARCQFYEQRLASRSCNLAMIAYDFLPWLHPELFSVFSKSKSGAPYMPYLHLICTATSVGFISERTRQDFLSRVLRISSDDSRIGPVLPLGADGLPIERQVWRKERRSFVCIGSLERRKNNDILAEAFMRLWQENHHVPLVMIGSNADEWEPDWLSRAKKYPHFSWLNAASDVDIAHVLRDARATIYLSTLEGFGLPPVESLWAGLPVIVSARVPSVAMLPRLGQIQLSDITADAVANAVLALQHDDTAECLWSETTNLQLDTWRIFSNKVAAWCERVAVRETC